MIPKEFDYVAPDSVIGALSALKDGGENAKILAGGHSLIPMLKIRLAEAGLLVDLRKVGELQGMRGNNGDLDIGAMTTHYALHTSGDIQQSVPLLSECAYSIGDAQVRARGTLGGSIAHADPAADLPAAVLALDATLVASSLGDIIAVATREIPASEFFQGLFTTALEPGEILSTIRVPRQTGRTGASYVKVRNKASHYALVGAAAVVGLDDNGVCNRVSVAVTGAASTPFRLTALENTLHGTRLSDDDISAAVGTLGGVDADWMSDLYGSAEYRKHLAGVVARRALEQARGRVG